MIDSLIPTGRDCDCGHPMVWRHGHPICAVYGAHREPPSEPLGFRNYNAPFAALVDELTALGGDRSRPRVRHPRLVAVA